MDPIIAARWNDGLLAQAAERYGVEAGALHELDGFESFIYKFERAGGRFVLRIGHSGRRTKDLIAGEVDWINYLAAGGAPVARAILSARGNLVEDLADGHGAQFLCTAFEHAPGGPSRRGQITERLVRNYGRLIGRMHTLAKTYQVSNPAWRRYDWDAPINTYGESQMPQGERMALERYREVLAYLRGLPRDVESYGMIHQDAHAGNFFVDADDNLTLFDFDDCVFGHFIYDIAMVLFYVTVGEPDPAQYAAWFLPLFLEGYRTENRLDKRWLRELPHFMKLREIDLFAAIQFASPEGGPPENSWSGRYLRGRRERIEQRTPLIDFDWDSLAEHL